MLETEVEKLWGIWLKCDYKWTYFIREGWSRAWHVSVHVSEILDIVVGSKTILSHRHNCIILTKHHR